jgi:hypothetical protein
MYFVYPARVEDRVLPTLVRKVGTIQRELGSLGEVLAVRLATRLEREGLHAGTEAAIEDEERQTKLFGSAVRAELESSRERADLWHELDQARERLDESRKLLELRPQLLHDLVNVGLGWAGAVPLAQAPPLADPKESHLAPYVVPDLDASWERTLDTLRPPRERGETPWDWRKRPLRTVVFDPPSKLSTPAVHLHLSHPFVQRILARFRSQGFSAHDLSRVTLVADPESSKTRVVAVGRLSLFGAGAARLHDELVMVTAAWKLGTDQLKPFADEADRKAQDRLAALLSNAPALPPLDDKTRARILVAAPSHFASLWGHIDDEADARSTEARRLLSLRGRTEAEDLRRILRAQLDLARSLLAGDQLRFDFGEGETEQMEQVAEDREWLAGRAKALELELASEPRELEASYDVVLERVEPVGLVYLWPTTS